MLKLSTVAMLWRKPRLKSVGWFIKADERTMNGR